MPHISWRSVVRPYSPLSYTHLLHDFIELHVRETDGKESPGGSNSRWKNPHTMHDIQSTCAVCQTLPGIPCYTAAISPQVMGAGTGTASYSDLLDGGVAQPPWPGDWVGLVRIAVRIVLAIWLDGWAQENLLRAVGHASARFNLPPAVHPPNSLSVTQSVVRLFQVMGAKSGFLSVLFLSTFLSFPTHSFIHTTRPTVLR